MTRVAMRVAVDEGLHDSNARWDDGRDLVKAPSLTDRIFQHKDSIRGVGLNYSVSK